MKIKSTNAAICNADQLLEVIALLKRKEVEQKKKLSATFTGASDWLNPGDMIKKRIYKYLRQRFPFFNFKR